MCGIVGLVQRNGAAADTATLELMAAAVAHRGPDDSGTWTDGPFGLGHRRLSIIDLKSGQQPMATADRRLWISYNGEIYNFRELAAELSGHGHRLRTTSDTEVVLYAYRQWGVDCVHHFRGMFAFAIADLDRRRLFLARDHLGIKPLFWVDRPHVFAFASELQALRCLPELGLQVDLEAVDQYLQLQYIPAPNTIYRQVHKLAPGHRMVVDLENGAQPPERYWKLEFRPHHGRSEEEWIEVLDGCLQTSVRAHLVADVPFGAFLSGGVDSSAVVAKMARSLPEPVKTFTIGFEEEEFSELGYARQVARRWGTEHHEEVLRPDAISILPTLVRHYGEPFGDSSAIPTYYVSRLAAASVPMVLSGDGGDELFAGYHSYRTYMRWLSFDGTPRWRRLAYPLAHLLRPQRYLRRRPDLVAWMSFIEVIPSVVRRRLWRREYRYLCDRPVPGFEEEYARARHYPTIQTLQSMDLNTYLPFAILSKVDVASMISSLEVRTPLVDKEVAELAATIPPELNFARAEGGEFEGKLLLKKALLRDYPEDFLRRPKMGFGVPLRRWFADQGSLHQVVNDRLLASSSPLACLFEHKVMAELIANNAYYPLWLLLFLDEWLRQAQGG